VVLANEDFDNPPHYAENSTAYLNEKHSKCPAVNPLTAMTVPLDMDVVAQYISSSN